MKIGVWPCWNRNIRKPHRQTAEGRLKCRPVRVTLMLPYKPVDQNLSAEERAKAGKSAYVQFVSTLRGQLHRHGVASNGPRQKLPVVLAENVA